MSKKLTTNQGVPIGDNQNSMTAGHRGPTLLEDYVLIEKLAHFDRERVPERVVHARGIGAHGVFTVKNSMKKYTKAAFLQEVGKETEVFVRFSTVIHGLHSPETLRDPRGFAVKFYTEEGNYDFVGNNLPVFFIRDAIKFPDVIHSLKPDPSTNMQDANRYWDFFSLTPEATTMITYLFSDEGIPASYRQIRGSSVHAFKWTNEEGKTVYIKMRWVPKAGIVNLSTDQASQIQAKEFSHATRDFHEAIENGDFPEWDLYIQVLDPADIDNYDFNPLDATKDWFEDVFPYELVGTMVLNRNPENIFAETESVGFNPGVLVPGILPSEDRMLQGRLFSYSDTQRHRVGPNYLQLPINSPKVDVNNNQRDGAMPFKQQMSSINYEPNSYDTTPKETPRYVEDEQELMAGKVGRIEQQKPNNFGHAREVWNRYSDGERDALVNNIVGDWEGVREDIKIRNLRNFYQVEPVFAERVAKGTGVDLEKHIADLK